MMIEIKDMVNIKENNRSLELHHKSNKIILQKIMDTFLIPNVSLNIQLTVV